MRVQPATQIVSADRLLADVGVEDAGRPDRVGDEHRARRPGAAPEQDEPEPTMPATARGGDETRALPPGCAAGERRPHTSVDGSLRLRHVGRARAGPAIARRACRSPLAVAVQQRERVAHLHEGVELEGEQSPDPRPGRARRPPAPRAPGARSASASRPAPRRAAPSPGPGACRAPPRPRRRSTRPGTPASRGSGGSARRATRGARTRSSGSRAGRITASAKISLGGVDRGELELLLRAEVRVEPALRHADVVGEPADREAVEALDRSRAASPRRGSPRASALRRRAGVSSRAHA